MAEVDPDAAMATGDATQQRTEDQTDAGGRYNLRSNANRRVKTKNADANGTSKAAEKTMVRDTSAFAAVDAESDEEDGAFLTTDEGDSDMSMEDSRDATPRSRISLDAVDDRRRRDQFHDTLAPSPPGSVNLAEEVSDRRINPDEDGYEDRVLPFTRRDKRQMERGHEPVHGRQRRHSPSWFDNMTPAELDVHRRVQAELRKKNSGHEGVFPSTDEPYLSTDLPRYSMAERQQADPSARHRNL